MSMLACFDFLFYLFNYSFFFPLNSMTNTNIAIKIPITYTINIGNNILIAILSDFVKDLQYETIN